MCRNLLKILAKTFTLLLFGICVAPPANATTITLDPATKTASIGDTINLNLIINNVLDLYGFQFSLQFDQRVINVSGLTEGNALSTAGTSFFVPGAFDNQNGFLELTGNTLIGPISGFTGSGVIASISFIAVGAGVSGIAINDLLLLDSSLFEITAPFGFAFIEIPPAATQIPEPDIKTILLFTLVAMRLTRKQKLQRSRLNIYSESRRVSRRLPLLRRWSHEEDNEIRPGSMRAFSADGVRAA